MLGSFPYSSRLRRPSWSKRYFKFEKKWLKAEGFVGKVNQWWTSYHVEETIRLERPFEEEVFKVVEAFTVTRLWASTDLLWVSSRLLERCSK